MHIKHFLVFILAIGATLSLSSQTLQIKFCGKTTEVVPAKDNSGADQRHKGGIRMDLIRVGKLTLSRFSPFYSLGIDPLYFQNNTWVDGCGNNTNQSYCSGCTTCKPILSTTNAVVGISEGVMEGNMRMRTANNDLFIESTGTQSVVCFITNQIDLSAHQGKKIEVNVIYEGTSQDGFSTTNINFSYRYNAGVWSNLLNQNSNFLRVIDTAILITVNVPTAVRNIDAIVDFTIFPNPVHDKIIAKLNSQNSFTANLSVLDFQSKLITEKEIIIHEGLNTVELNSQHLSSGMYLLQLTDKEGRVSSKKFIKD